MGVLKVELLDLLKAVWMDCYSAEMKVMWKAASSVTHWAAPKGSLSVATKERCWAARMEFLRVVWWVICWVGSKDWLLAALTAAMRVDL